MSPSIDQIGAGTGHVITTGLWFRNWAPRPLPGHCSVRRRRNRDWCVDRARTVPDIASPGAGAPPRSTPS
jgi:hypothetical protein